MMCSVVDRVKNLVVYFDHNDCVARGPVGCCCLQPSSTTTQGIEPCEGATN